MAYVFIHFRHGGFQNHVVQEVFSIFVRMLSRRSKNVVQQFFPIKIVDEIWIKEGPKKSKKCRRLVVRYSPKPNNFNTNKLELDVLKLDKY